MKYDTLGPEAKALVDCMIDELLQSMDDGRIADPFGFMKHPRAVRRVAVHDLIEKGLLKLWFDKTAENMGWQLLLPDGSWRMM